MTCLFCGTKKNITGEHVWPAWISNVLGMKEYHGRFSFHEKLMGTLLRWHRSKRPKKSSGIPKKVRLCYQCNHDVLGPFEERVKPIMSKMILGESVTLGREQQL